MSQNEIVAETRLPDAVVLQLVKGDITREEVDAIVNPANEQLLHGGGLAGVILRQGGQEIQRESTAWIEEHGPVTHEKPAVTQAGDLPSQYVLHAVGPVWGSGDEARKLAAAVVGALRTAEDLNLTSVALPAISTGVFGYPVRKAAGVILGAVRGYFDDRQEGSLNLVRIVLFDEESTQAFQAQWQTLGLQSV